MHKHKLRVHVHKKIPCDTFSYELLNVAGVIDANLLS